jgi:hypothetical protein
MSDNIQKEQRYCRYYQAHVERERTWFFTSLLRAQEHLCFDRTLDPHSGLFEFFVPEGLEAPFESFMHTMHELGVVSNLNAQPNRLANPHERL